MLAVFSEELEALIELLLVLLAFLRRFEENRSDSVTVVLIQNALWKT